MKLFWGLSTSLAVKNISKLTENYSYFKHLSKERPENESCGKDKNIISFLNVLFIIEYMPQNCL